MPASRSPDPRSIPADQKSFARSLFASVMEELNVPKRMHECFVVEGDRLHVGTDWFELNSFSKVLLASVGKAAVPMAEYAVEMLAKVIPVSGVVVGIGEWTPPNGIAYFVGGHPLPDEQSFAAGQALLEVMRTADEDTLVLFLISGGASAMAETPLDASIPRSEIVDFYRMLLHSGLPIEKTNALRKHLSAIKGGRLALAAAGATLCTLLISDVPPGKLNVVGSGLSLPDTSTAHECRELLANAPAFRDISPRLQAFFETMPETPKALPSGRFPSMCFSALSSDSMIEAARLIAIEAGYRVVVDNSCDDWDYQTAAAYLFDRALNESAADGPVCLLSAGEVTVSIAGAAGEGGRNQQWALEIARLAAGRMGVVALSAGSDGIDGNSPAAGAVVDGMTWTRALLAGSDPQQALDHFDTYPLFAKLDDAIIPGPSGNNMRDLRMILICQDSAPPNFA
jgi:glycerate 2-kinase